MVLNDVLDQLSQLCDDEDFVALTVNLYRHKDGSKETTVCMSTIEKESEEVSYRGAGQSVEQAFDNWLISAGLKDKKEVQYVINE